MQYLLLCAWLVLTTLRGGFAAAGVEDPALNKALNERIVFIHHSAGVDLETTIFTPDGDGPFPLAVINHGKSPGDPQFQARARYIVASRELVRRGYAVAIPMRAGFARSSGSYVEGGCNITGNGLRQAEYVRTVLDYMTKQSYVDRSHIVLMGQSHGGLTAMAFAAEGYEGVRGIINFAGGLRLVSSECSGWQQSLVQAYRKYGHNAGIPSLWFFGENDSYFSPELARRMYGAFSRSGGRARMIAYGAFKNDAHNLFVDRDGLAIWWPETENFLASVGMPVRPAQHLLTEDPALKALADAKRIPYVKANCANVYGLFLDADYPRAYAISADSHCGYAYGGEDPKKRAIEFCQRVAGKECKLYAVDDALVWKGEQLSTDP
jgi:dienelactone hydrolase